MEKYRTEWDYEVKMEIALSDKVNIKDFYVCRFYNSEEFEAICDFLNKKKIAYKTGENKHILEIKITDEYAFYEVGSDGSERKIVIYKPICRVVRV